MSGRDNLGEALSEFTAPAPRVDLDGETILATVVDPDGYEVTVRTSEYGLRLQIAIPEEETYMVADLTTDDWASLVQQVALGLGGAK